MYTDYSDEVVESLRIIDYELVELKIINEYFTELIQGKKLESSKVFYEKSTQEHIKYINLLGEHTSRIKIKLEINKESGLLKEFNEILKKNNPNFIDTYNDGCNNECLIDFKESCDSYIDYINKLRKWLINFAKTH
ncbi:hypothetical protein SAMN05444401_3557 [Clostridium amylolyticum]|uniref:Uncharacterized protein n=1 Tax=Clostridium amylolyticum TaxID=1121298 RepID=A0A1M6KZW3_9CLOT|nr:hypothetical protein [Clostridium amylolyticum]SHJ64531.1 hypothetical protein SAMN05444401_3557 [Clostridium amylolyticum]